jgi:hypothetical protein
MILSAIPYYVYIGVDKQADFKARAASLLTLYRTQEREN